MVPSLSAHEVRYETLRLLSFPMYGLVLEFLAKLTEKGIMVKIVETWRTQERHLKLLSEGRSWTANSKHLLTRKFDGTEIPAAEAIDLAPYEIWNLAGADKLMWAEHPVWERMGEIGELVGLKWGGRWAKRDLGHWEL